MKNTKELYKVVEADSDMLDKFYDDNSLTFEGYAISKENTDFLYNWLKEMKGLKDEVLPIYTYTGSLMNEKYELEGKNRYPDGLHFITIMLSDITCSSMLIYERFEIGGRWFNDIVDNNRMM